jgi:hypothetical protein
MAIDANGIHQTEHLVNGPISGFGIGHIAAADGKLFDDHGNVYDVNNSFAKIGTFNTSGNFAVDAELGKLFSVVLSGGQNRIEVYDLNTLEHLNTISGMGVLGPVSTSNLIRVGADGLAFSMSSGRVAIIYSAAVPEPSSWLLAMAAFPALAMYRRPRRTRRI